MHFTAHICTHYKVWIVQEVVLNKKKTMDSNVSGYPFSDQNHFGITNKSDFTKYAGYLVPVDPMVEVMCTREHLHEIPEMLASS